MRPVFLIGYMGCGKTTLGHAVARDASMRFIDLDEYIEEREGMTVRDIFERHGEPYFRRLERETLGEVAAMTDVIIATGGGTPCQPGLMELMNSAGLTVHLTTTPEVLHRRLIEGRDKRPLIARLDDEALRAFIDTALESRMPFYSMARVTFDSTRLETVSEIADTSARFIDTLLVNV